MFDMVETVVYNLKDQQYQIRVPKFDKMRDGESLRLSLGESMAQTKESRRPRACRVHIYNGLDYLVFAGWSRCSKCLHWFKLSEDAYVREDA